MDVTVENEATFTRMQALGKCLLAVFTALKAGARRAAWWNLHESTPSFFRFGAEGRKEPTPRSVMDRLGHAAGGVGDHLHRSQVFDRDQAVLRNDPMGQLVLEVLALVRCLRIKIGYAALCLLTALGTALLSTQLLLGAFESSFSFPIPARVIDFLSGRERGETLQAHIDTDLRSCGRVCVSGYFVAGEGGIPVASLAFERNCFRLSLNRAMKFYPDLSNLGKPKMFCPDKMKSLILWPGQAVITVSTFESWIPRSLTEFYAPKELPEGEINSMKRLLKDLRIEFGVFRPKLLNFRKLTALCSVPDRNAAFPCLTALFNSGIMEFTAAIEPFGEHQFLRFSGIQPILEGPAESSYNRISHDVLLSHKGRLGQKPATVRAVIGFDYYVTSGIWNQVERNWASLVGTKVLKLSRC